MEDIQDLNLTFSGCGFLGIYHIGVMSCLKQNATGFLRRVKCFGGASAGAFAAVGLVVDLDISEVAESVIRLAKRAKSLSLGPLHPRFQIVKTVRRAFEKMLPENAHELASGRLHISLTHVPDCQNVIISEFYSKEDLIEALVASSYVPFYSGIFPAVFRGKYYVDGGISDNLPQHFKEGETITVSPFSGEHDICPKDVSSNDVHIELRNTSIQINCNNLQRLASALFPTDETGLSDICRQGYRDTLRFLKEHYPETLTQGSPRTASMSLDLPPSHSNPPASCQETLSSSRKTSCSSEILSNSSFCSCSEIEVFSGSESEKDETEVEEGESKLSMLLHQASQAATEAELWSCFLVRRSKYFLKVFAQPCVITINQVVVMLKIFLELLTKVEKTGNKYFDELLSVITTMFHTYEDRHQVSIQTWKSGLQVTEIPRGAAASLLTLSEWTKNMSDDSRSCKCRCNAEGLATSCDRECSMAHAGSNACTVNMDAGSSDDTCKFIFNANALCRELQECLSETMVMMERHVGDSYAGKESDNTQDESNNNSSVIV
ncbi:omega-hydroxyceramide transacylase-like isoform X2 [Oculina patagonica]